MPRPSEPALENRAVFAVNRKQSGAVLCCGLRHHGARRDKRFLVGKRHRLSAFKRGNHRSQACKTNNSGDNDVDWTTRQRRAGGLANDDFDP